MFLAEIASEFPSALTPAASEFFQPRDFMVSFRDPKSSYRGHGLGQIWFWSITKAEWQNLPAPCIRPSFTILRLAEKSQWQTAASKFTIATILRRIISPMFWASTSGHQGAGEKFSELWLVYGSALSQSERRDQHDIKRALKATSEMFFTFSVLQMKRRSATRK